MNTPSTNSDLGGPGPLEVSTSYPPPRRILSPDKTTRQEIHERLLEYNMRISALETKWRFQLQFPSGAAQEGIRLALGLTLLLSFLMSTWSLLAKAFGFAIVYYGMR
jgi:hypothetical protein